MNRLSRIMLGLAVAATAAQAAQAEPLRHVFYFIGDGMGTGPVLTAQTFNRMVLGQSDPLLMMTFPVASNVYTYSYSSPVTDSAAGGTALATGVKTRNNMVGMAPDTVAVESVARRLSDVGWSIGIITSNAPDDATPASFYAHQPARSMYEEIGRDMATSGFEFFGGAPLRGLKNKKGKDTGLRQMIEGMSYQIVEGRAGLDSISSHRVVALNDVEGLSNSLGYAIDGPTGGFNLEELTRACLATLERNPDGFFMMVEDGLIDHSLHGNDAPTAIRQVINFQNAINVAYQFYLAHPDDTLIIVTADHDTGGFTLGNDNPAVKYNARLDLLAPVATSKAMFSKRVKEIFSKPPKGYCWDDMRQLLTDTFGFWATVDISDSQTERLEDLFEDALEGKNKDKASLYDLSDTFTDEVYRLLNYHAGVAFVTGYHTGGFVPVYAIGAGASKFASLNNNIDIPARIWDVMMESLPHAEKAY